MAVIKKVRGLHITISGKKEYIDPDAEKQDDTVTKYIEAISGEEFSIEWHFYNGFKFKDNDIKSEVHLDGKMVDGIVFSSQKLKCSSGHSETLTGARLQTEGRWAEHKFSFASLNIDEDNHGLHTQGLKESIHCLGEISVRLWAVRITKNLDSSEGLTLNFDTLEAVPEKALKGKAVSHQATLGAARAISPIQVLRTEYLDASKEPFAVFNFRYRSHKALQALGMIPRTPEPVPLEERPIESLTPVEMRELLQRLKGQNSKREVEVKRERGSDDEGDGEGARKRLQGAARGPTETIDLTDD